MKKLLFVFGTRPEAIKMCPLFCEMQKRGHFLTRLCTTGQHRELLDGVLSAFGVRPDHDLSVFREGQSLAEMTAAILSSLTPYLEKEVPDLVLLHGDTAGSLSAALAAFYLHVPVAHIEAGLRTYDMENPFPEEMNRRFISLVARYHFAPTAHARENLLREGVCEKRIFVTGNTGLDALKSTVRADYTHPLLEKAGGRRVLLLTAHRRENLGEGIASIFRAVRRVCEEDASICIIYPMHPNPRVRALALDAFSGCENALLSEPLGFYDFHNILARATLVLTDSGGVQEEAAFLACPTLVLRNCTERQEGVQSGALLLAGTEEESVYRSICAMLSDGAIIEKMKKASNPFGDGRASIRIADVLEKELL